jgi:hypothetical protein
MKRDDRGNRGRAQRADMSDVAALIAALGSESSDDRKAAAASLAASTVEPAVSAALIATLSDTAPKVRKSAAMALAHEGHVTAVEPIAAAIAREEFEWVRASMILALGRIGGAEAADALAGLEPASEQEQEAMAKARDRVSDDDVDVRWRAGAPVAGVHGFAPAGLEDIAVAEAKSFAIMARKAGAGLLQFPTANPAGLLGRLRCLFEIRILVASHESLSHVPPADVPKQLAELLVGAEFLRRWRDTIDTSGEMLRYRFSLEGLQLPKSVFRDTLSAVRGALAQHALTDSPSRYAALLRIEVTPAATRIWFVPTFERDERFAYRRADVGASIAPVVGACLARLVRSGAEGVVVDPTCGSATLLIERALLDDGVTLVGMDVSPTAARAAGENIIAASLSHRIAIRRGDAAERAAWPPQCREVIANLPFGVRSAAMDRDLKSVYRGIVNNAAETLQKGGRALLYTGNPRLMAPELESERDRLQVVEERAVTAGGLPVRVWVLRRR